MGKKTAKLVYPRELPKIEYFNPESIVSKEMTKVLKVERATSDEHGFIGYRLEAGGKKLLVWDNQEKMEGFRISEKFIPNLTETITYHEVNVQGEEK